MENDTEALKLIWRDHIIVSNAVTSLLAAGVAPMLNRTAPSAFIELYNLTSLVSGVRLS